MITGNDLAILREQLGADENLTRYIATIERRAAPVRDRLPPIPRVKAMLSRDGGFCPEDRTPLGFDPWSPDRHRCPRCGKSFSGDRHHRHWARAQHLWLAGRTVDLALLAALRDDTRAAERAHELFAIYQDLYFELPNRDNVLGPTHLFFSTYLESLWINSWLTAGVLLREAEMLPEEPAEGIGRVADEAATLIAEFNEGMSNRQTWNAAALAAIAVWFDDGELLTTTVEARTGMVGHLADGFTPDGSWWEGENYHLFALRGLMQGIRWARMMEYDVLEDPEVRDHFRAALLAPARTALPDFTYPARRDSRYGVSLAHPASLEQWEMGRLWLGEDEELEAWLSALYAVPAPPLGDVYDAWLNDAGLPVPSKYDRTDLSWWVAPAIPLAPPRDLPWQPPNVLLPSQGLAVLRQSDRYASLECGPVVGGHGHPDRLHLTVHAAGVHWLPDPGTASYVHETLHWYRSALAHNAPLLDGQNAAGLDAWCAGFDAGERFAWARGRAGGLTRTIVLGQDHLVDIVELKGESERELLLPWHFLGSPQVESPGAWEPATLEHPLVSDVMRNTGAGATVRVRVTRDERHLEAHLLAPDAELLKATAPGLPVEAAPREFLVQRASASTARWITVVDFTRPGDPASVRGVSSTEDSVEVETQSGKIRYVERENGLVIEAGGAVTTLSGARPSPKRRAPLFGQRPETEARAYAPRIESPPSLDGTLDGFDLDAPLLLDGEHQYRRSEEPYDPERLSAEAWANWDGQVLYLAVTVHKPDRVFRPADAPPLELDNDPEDVHSDGLQIYLSQAEQFTGVLVIPESGGRVRTRVIGADPSLQVDGRWREEPGGYTVTLQLSHPSIAGSPIGGHLGFDLLVNEMQPARTRRAGQLVWSGGNGWVYLRGDRQEQSSLGVLELG
jgi:hypothetical protein